MHPELFGILIQIGLPLFIIIFAMVVGSYLERRHFASIRRREEQLRHIAVLSTKEYPTDMPIKDARMVQGAVVVSIDYFKRFLAGFRKLIGGEIKSFAPLLDRGRREAILRMKEQCPNAHLLVNLRIQTSSISKGAKKKIGSTEVIAYATAITYDQADSENN